jgi:hypothetical protein
MDSEAHQDVSAVSRKLKKYNDLSTGDARQSRRGMTTGELLSSTGGIA